MKCASSLHEYSWGRIVQKVRSRWIKGGEMGSVADYIIYIYIYTPLDVLKFGKLSSPVVVFLRFKTRCKSVRNYLSRALFIENRWRKRVSAWIFSHNSHVVWRTCRCGFLLKQRSDLKSLIYVVNSHVLVITSSFPASVRCSWTPPRKVCLLFVLWEHVTLIKKAHLSALLHSQAWVAVSSALV